MPVRETIATPSSRVPIGKAHPLPQHQFQQSAAVVVPVRPARTQARKVDRSASVDAILNRAAAFAPSPGQGPAPAEGASRQSQIEVGKRQNSAATRDPFFRQMHPSQTTPAEPARSTVGKVVRTMSPDDARQRAIQRKVGFELEMSSWYLWQPKDEKTDLESAKRDTEKRKPFKKGEPILKKKGYELQADDAGNRSDMEIVTDPIDENDERRLRSIMKSIDGVIKGTVQHILDAGGGKTDFDVAFRDLGEIMQKGFVDTSGGVNFKPQATAGIKLEALGQMMADIGAPQAGESQGQQARLEPGRQTLMSKPSQDSGNAMGAGILTLGEAVPQIAAAISAYKVHPRIRAMLNQHFGRGWQGSAALRNLAALVYAYIEMARRPLQNYAKAIAPLMARTDFAQMFSMLPEDEREYFSANDGVEWIRLIGMAPAFGQPRTFSDGSSIPAVKMDAPFFEGGIYHSKQGYDHGVLDPLTRRDWLWGMTRGIDYLTAIHIQATGVGDQGPQELESLGSLGGKTEEVGAKSRLRRGKGRAQAPIFEMRGMQSVHFDQLQTWALQVMRYVRAINRGQNKKFGE